AVRAWRSKSFQKLCASARSEVSPSHSRAKARARSRISLRLSGTGSSPGGSQRLRRVPTAQQVEEGAVHVVVVAAHLDLVEQAVCRQCVQVAGGGEARHAQLALRELDARIWMVEQVVDQVLAVEPVV